jgi:peptidyl-dipeptidase Dcp
MSKHWIVGAGVLALAVAGVVSAEAVEPKSAISKPLPMTTPALGDVLLAKWTGPYQGVPPFDKVKVEQFKPALEAGMTKNLADIDAITANPAAPNFENTIAALERAGRELTRAISIYNVYSSTMSTPEFQAVERDMAPKLAAFQDKINQNEKLFKRVEVVYQAREKSGLTPEQQRLVWLDYTGFVRSGAKLDAAGKKRVADINERLATLYTSFQQNVLADESGYVTYLEKEADLAGLPPSLVSAAAEAAESKGKKGQWAITNTRSSMEPFLTFSSRRDLREKVWRTYYSRGDHNDEHDNKKIITEILKLRAERAKLLGYETHAHWRLENTMAKTPERAMALMEAVWKPAVARVHEEVADMQALADQEKADLKIAPWDYRYYAEKVRKAKYDLDENEIKPYLQLEKLREGMFWVAGQLFGFQFTPATGSVPVLLPDIRVWEVKDSAGKHVGLWYFDPYARTGKQSGAWMNEYRPQERFEGAIPVIVSNNTNFVKAKAGEPILVSWDDAQALFHEFGHALHGLNSNVNYPSLAGTSVARDYVEFPSQLLEHWLETPEVLQKFAVNVEGKPIPPELVAKIQRASKFNQGFITVEYLAAALVDMKMHLAGSKEIDPAAFERDTLKELGMPEEIVMRHRIPQFGHVFAGDGYSAGYYSYLWSDTLSSDAWEAFGEAGGPYDKAVAKRLHDYVFSLGNSVDPAEAYRKFRGRDAGIGALMRQRGFPEPATTQASTR